jgi:hypothetical protein
MVLRGGYILHLDGTCEADSSHLFTGMDGIARIALDNARLALEKTELLIPFFRRIKRQYGDPLALVHDMGKDLFEEEYAVIRNRLRKHGIRKLLAKRLKALEEMVKNGPEQIHALADGIDTGHIDPEALGKTTNLNAVSLTGGLIFEKEALLFNTVPSWEFSIEHTAE